MPTKGQWKVLGVLAPVVIVFYTAGIWAVAEMPAGIWWDALAVVTPLACGFGGVWLTHALAKWRRWL